MICFRRGDDEDGEVVLQREMARSPVYLWGVNGDDVVAADE